MIKKFSFFWESVGGFIHKRSSAALTFLMLLLALIFIVLVFKNIQYPLLWNDEGDTVVFGQRVLRYGYPKIHGEKNVIYHFIGALPDLAVKKSIDAHILGNWGHYYFVAPILLLADLTNDIYAKTAILRIPFATLSLVSILLFGVTFSKIVSDPKKRTLLGVFYLCLEILSLFLILDIRQVRHHPLVLSFSLMLFIAYINHAFFHKTKGRYYTTVLSFLLVIIFSVFYPVYFIFVITLFIHEISGFPKPLRFDRGLVRRLMSNSTFVSIIISLFFVIPMFFYFEIPRVSLGLSEYFSFRPQHYLQNILNISSFLFIFEYLGMVIILQGYLYAKRKSIETLAGYKISRFFFLFLCVYILVISRSPFMSSRYLLTLQPVIAAIITINVFLAFQVKNSQNLLGKNIGVLIALILLFVAGSIFKLFYLKQYLYEISHQYRGVIDYMVPYIKSEYENPQDLVIATNYEEQVLMYYLDAKVIVGYAGKNIANDLKLYPDIIIPRKGFNNFQNEIYNLIDKGSYKKTDFSVYDYYVNNIPELFWGPQHLFSTRYAGNSNEALEIYEKIK